MLGPTRTREDGHAFSCAARRGGAMNTALEFNQLLNRRTALGGFGRDAEFFGGGTRLGWLSDRKVEG